MARHLDEEGVRVKALQFERNMPRFAAARVASALVGSGKGVKIGPLELVELEPFDRLAHHGTELAQSDAQPSHIQGA